MGYRRAGFRVIGVDNEDHRKSFEHVGEFHQMDWAEGLKKFADEANFIHLSPPCQGYSNLTSWGRRDNLTTQKLKDLNHERLIEPAREAVITTGKPWILENVGGAPLQNPVMLCCWTFGYEQYRHRFFEAGGGLELTAPLHRPHEVLGRKTGHRENGKFHSVAGHYDSSDLAHEVMNIQWMRGTELSESIPPYFTEYLGVQVLRFLGRNDLLTIWSRKNWSNCHNEHDHEAWCLLQGGRGPVAQREVWASPKFNRRYQNNVLGVQQAKLDK
jgi:DNA (cytosine-5)-methyltransferase 1